VFRESHRVHDALETAAGRLLLARGAPEIWTEAVDGRSRPSNRDRRLWSEAPFLLLGPDGDRPMAEVAVPVLDSAGQPRAALCARGNPSTFPEDVLKNEVAPHLVRAARAAGRAMADA
jgi:IclR family acetate operon transcriptional repressor